VRTVSFVNTIT